MLRLLATAGIEAGPFCRRQIFGSGAGAIIPSDCPRS